MISKGARLATLALASTGAFALAACEEHPYPSAAPRQATAAPPPDDSTLAGAPTGPEGYPPPPSTRSPAYAPQGYGPQGYRPPGYPPPGYPAPGPEMAQSAPSGAPYGPPPANPPQAYGQPYERPLVGRASMDPIPNPPERPRRYERGYAGRRHHAYRTQHIYRTQHAYGPPVHAGPYRHHPHRHPMAYASVAHHPAAHHLAPVHTTAPVVHTAPPAPTYVKPKPVTAAPQAQLAKPQALDHHRRHHHAATATAAAAAAGVASNTTAASNTTGSTSEADRYTALQQSLHDAFGNDAQLSVPAHMEANQASTVTLTIPADFAQTVRTEAAKQGLTAQAATVNLMASLSGDGYLIVPGEAQSQPLTLNTPTSFQWKVTPTGAGRGTLKASVRAAVGEGHDLALGDKTTGSGAATGRVVGIGLLALIALVLLGWAAQRRRPKMTGASKPRATHTNGTI